MMVGQRLVNDSSFECSSLKGKELESFVSFYEGDETNGVDIIVLKVKGVKLYQRFFLDAGIGFWEEWTQQQVYFDFEDTQQRNLISKFDISGNKVNRIICDGSSDSLSSIRFEIGNRILELKYVDSNDEVSDTILESLLIEEQG